jgi:hypothetical protein
MWTKTKTKCLLCDKESNSCYKDICDYCYHKNYNFCKECHKQYFKNYYQTKYKELYKQKYIPSGRPRGRPNKKELLKKNIN